MLDRMIGVARAKVMRYLAAFGAFGIASAANAQTVEYEFHFNDPPTSDCTEVDEFCFYYDPTFEVSGFEVTHTADEGDAVQWIGVSESQGYVQDSTAGGFSAVIGFEEEVDSFGICLTVTDDGEIIGIDTDGVIHRYDGTTWTAHGRTDGVPEAFAYVGGAAPWLMIADQRGLVATDDFGDSVTTLLPMAG